MTKRDHVLRALQVCSQRGPAGRALAEHLMAKLADEPDEDAVVAVRGVLRSLQGAIRELYAELIAIES